jgi:GT2 family glycosyltransferase
MIGIPFIIPCLNRFDMFTETIETVDTAIRPIVIDAWRNNRGVSGAWNEGMRRARDLGYRWALISNDDLKYPPGAIEELYKTIVETGAGVVSPNQVRLPLRQHMFENEGLREGADFFCFFIDIPQVTEQAGWFDQNFYPAYFEDNDMHRRMILAGVKGYVRTDIDVIHEGSMTQKFDKYNPNVTTERFEAHRGYFRKKWGGEPTDATYLTPFNEPDLTVRDWNGSMVLDGLETSPAQELLDRIDSKCYDVAYESY